MSTNNRAVAKIILDTDPGGDDIFAFLWLQSLIQQGFAELIAVTTAEGNVSAQKTFSSACQVLALGDLSSVEVGRGVRVNRQSTEDAAHIHGNDGMGNLSTTLPALTQTYETAKDSDDLIIEKLNALPGEITLIAIGPLTNLASAETKSPGILKKAKEIIVMGGAFCCPGNITATAEFNIWFNPEATQMVLNSRDDLVILPLDLTRHLIFTPEMAKAVTQTYPTTQLAQFITNLCEFMVSTALQYRETAGVRGFLVHDAATLGYLFYPHTLRLQRAHVQVETQGEHTCGQTLLDRRSTITLNPNTWVALEVDRASFFTHFVEDLQFLVNTLASKNRDTTG